MQKSPINTILMDVDDSLTPWEKPHAAGYPAMTKALAEASEINEKEIIANIRLINTQYGTIEYTALVQEMPCFSAYPRHQIEKLIDLAQYSRNEAMKDLTPPLPEIEVMLETFITNRLARIAISDAPVNLAYLRLKKAGLTSKIESLIGLRSPDDNKFPQKKRMYARIFEVPPTVSPIAKPNTNLEELLGKTWEEINRTHVMIGNSLHSDVGLAKRYGMLIYVPTWYKSTPAERAVLQQYAPQKILARNVGTQSPQEASIPAAPGFEMVEVESVQQLLDDMKKREIIQ